MSWENGGKVKRAEVYILWTFGALISEVRFDISVKARAGGSSDMDIQYEPNQWSISVSADYTGTEG